MFLQKGQPESESYPTTKLAFSEVCHCFSVHVASETFDRLLKHSREEPHSLLNLSGIFNIGMGYSTIKSAESAP
jgi:hypothetical protein